MNPDELSTKFDKQGLTVLHLELDQFPEQRHAYLIAQKLLPLQAA